MPRRVAAPKKMGPNKKALISKPAPPATSSSAATPPTPPPPPPPAPARLSGRRQSSLPASQQDIFDEMMGTEISSDNSNSSPEASPAAAPEVLRRKSPRFPETATATSSAGDVASDDSSLAEPMVTPEMTSAPAASGSSRRKPPALKKTQSRALKEIAKLQGTTNPVIPKLPFARLIREILMEYSHRDLRVTPEMLMCLQESAEIFAVQLMEDAYRCTLHRDRITLMPKDMKLAVMLRKDSVML